MSIEPSLLAGSRAVLIGVSAYEYREFPPIRAARNSLEAMRRLLCDPALCGWPPEQITVIANPSSTTDLAGQIADLAESATGVLLLYYAGHGALSTRGELCLTVSSTRPDRPKITGLPWDALAEVLRASPAQTRIAILDCCFAGQAIEALAGDDGDDGPALADITHVRGVYTLTATTRNRTAHVPPPDQQETACTSFTAELCDLIHTGLPGKPSPLTLGDIYPALRTRLRAKGLPAPHQRGTDTAAQFPFTANRAAPGSDAPDVRPRQDRQYSAGRPSHAELPQTLGQAGELPTVTPTIPITAVDEGPARPGSPTAGNGQESLLDRAIRIACDLDDPDQQTEALVGIAREAPDHAEQILQHIASPWLRARELLAHYELLDHAEGIIAQLPDDTSGIDRQRQVEALATLADKLGDTAPRRAIQAIERVLRLPPDPEPELEGIRVLAGLAARVARTSAAHAAALVDHAAQHLPDSAGERAMALAALAHAAAAIDSDRASRLINHAEHLARTLPSDSGLPDNLALIARQGWDADPECAERLVDLAEQRALALTEENDRNWGLGHIALAVASAYPYRAEQLISKITQRLTRGSVWRGIIKEAEAAHRDNVPNLIAAATASVLEGIEDQETHGRGDRQTRQDADCGTFRRRLRDAFTGRSDCEATDRRTTHVEVSTDDLRHAVWAVASFDPQRAESLAMLITEDYQRVKALVGMAEHVAETDPARARRWLDDAYQAALGFPVSKMVRVATGYPTDENLTEQIAVHIVSLDDAATKDVGAFHLRQLANSLAAAHPYQALRLLDLAETREREDYVGPRESYDWYHITDVLIAIAAAGVRSDPERGELMAQRALLTAHSIDSPEDKSRVEWSPLLAVLVAQNPDRAEEFVRSITDDTLRTGALQELVLAIVEQHTATTNV